MLTHQAAIFIKANRQHQAELLPVISVPEALPGTNICGRNMIQKHFYATDAGLNIIIKINKTPSYVSMATGLNMTTFVVLE